MTSELQRQKAAETARANFTKHPRWTDADGVSQPFSKHPYYDICRHLLDRSQREARCQPDPDFRYYPEICEAWQDLPTFVLELGVTAGVRPRRHSRLRRVFLDEPLGPGNAEWWEPQLTRRQRYFVFRGGHLA